jgi:hypothetical protein
LNPDRRIPLVPKNAMDTYESLARLEIIKINKSRKEQGLGYLTQTEQEKIIAKHQETEQQQPSKPVTSGDMSKQYGISNEALTSLLAMFSTKRQEAIAKASQKDIQLILEFKKKEPPKLGEKPATDSEKFNQLPVHYNKVPWDIYEEIQRLQGQLADLNRLKQMTLSIIDQDGRKIREPVLAKNNPDMTGMTDIEFSSLSRKIADTQIKLYQVAGLWMYGLPEDRTVKCETLTLALAIEAGLYRLQYGYPAENPNYSSFLT